ncbi:MAG: hypothetical protein K2P52_02550 [Campylobacterales bacterium]|nr:hypothetical protein [Campylobacterales bacterium]
MADSKVTQLPSLTTPASEDLIYIIDNPAGTPASKKISLLTLFANIPSDANVTGDISATGDLDVKEIVANNISLTGRSIQITTFTTPSTSTDNTYPRGTILLDENYLYVKVTSNTFKRIALTSF